MGAGLLAYDVSAGRARCPGIVTCPSGRHRAIPRPAAGRARRRARSTTTRRWTTLGWRWRSRARPLARAAMSPRTPRSSDGCRTSREGVHRVVVARRARAATSTSSRRGTSRCASGVWAPEVSAVFTESDNAVGIIRSKGVHLRLPRSAIDGETALIVPTGKSVLFVLPSRTHWLVGTTDTEWMGDPDAVAPTQEDVEYLLGPAQRGGPSARHRRRRDLHVRGAAPPRPRPVRRRQHREGDPRASHRARGAGRAGHRRREVDHVPGDGTRPRRHGAQRVRAAGTDMPHSGAATGGIGRRDGGRRRRPCGARPRTGPAPGGCTGVHARRRRVRLHG